VDFLKHHYEKLILAVLLVAFIGMMFYVLNIIQDTRKVDDSKLEIQERTADYVVAEPDKKENVDLRPADYWKASALNWQKSDVRKDKSSDGLHFSDLVQIYPMSRCPECNAIIPKDYFSEKPCPNCKFLLKTPPERPKFRLFRKSEADLDGDGISNDDEKKYGLNPENPEDAQYDKDGDGFSNIFELQYGTALDNPQSHPPLWMRLRLVSIDKIVLPLKFMVLNVPGPDQNVWDIQINTPPRRKGKKTDDTRFYRLGDLISIEKRKYKIVRIERIIKEAKASENADTSNVVHADEVMTAAKRQLDKSKIYLEEDLNGKPGKPDKLVLVRGEIVYSSDRRPVLEDLGFPEGNVKYTLRMGDIFNIGDRRTKVSRYQVMKMDEEKRTVLLRDLDKKELKDGEMPIVVTAEGEIAEDMRILMPKAGEKNDTSAL